MDEGRRIRGGRIKTANSKQEKEMRESGRDQREPEDRGGGAGGLIYGEIDPFLSASAGATRVKCHVNKTH